MNIYTILESLQRVEESAMAEADALIQNIVNGHVDIYDVYAHPKDPIEKYVSDIIHKYYNEVVIDTGLHADDDFEPIFDRVIDQLQQDYNVELDETFTGYWKGTDKRTPGNKMVGSCEESIEQECDTPMSPVERKLRALWAQHKKEVDENIVPTGTAAPANQQDPQKAIQDQAKMKGELDQAKSKGLLPSTTNTQQSSQALTALTQAGGDMNKVPANMKQKLGPMITGIAGALGAGAKNPAQASKVNQAMSTLGQVNKAAE